MRDCFGLWPRKDMIMQRTWIYETKDKVGESVRLNGWVHRIRRMGDKLVFIDLRDASGIAQVVCYKPDLDEATIAAVDELGAEYVLQIEGVVQMRGEKQANPEMVTGQIEIATKSLTILNRCKTPPFEIDKDTMPVNEELRLKYRYLDLRSERMHKNIWMRSTITRTIRDFLYGHEFSEIETAILTKARVSSPM